MASSTSVYSNVTIKNWSNGNYAILTVSIAIVEIIYGIRSRSQLLIADGLFSFAEGIALVGSLIALRYAKAERLHSRNTFGYVLFI